MSPLIALALRLFPTILDSIVGDRSKKVTEAIEKVVSSAAGSSDPQVVEQRLKTDPALAVKLQIELAQIARDEKKVALDAQNNALNARLSAEADARKAALSSDIEAYKAQLAQTANAQKAELDRRIQDLQNTSGARNLQGALIDKGSAIAYVPAALSLVVTVGFFCVLGLFIFMKAKLETPVFPSIPSGVTNEQLTALLPPRSEFVTQIINISVGSLTAAFATVISYWLGSSLGSRNKDLIAVDVQERNAESQANQAKETLKYADAAIAQASAAAERADAATNDEASPSVVVETRATESAKPAPPNILGEEMPKLTHPHGHFPTGVTWSIVSGGISIEGASAQGTTGEPTTVRKIWDDYGALCAETAKRYGVPAELIVATIATESGGNPNSRRAEPKINDESIGLMQTLVTTARSATGRATLSGDDLLDPRTSIEAGTAYIASQRGSTHFDPPLVAAAYNAGSLKRDDGDANRWKLHCYPRGTGAHIDRFVSWFGDAMRVSGDDDWSDARSYPTFAAALGAVSNTVAIDISSVDFPQRPNFRPLLALEDKQEIFGRFDFVPSPIPGNPENIKILGNWEKQNIASVEFRLRAFWEKVAHSRCDFTKRPRSSWLSSGSNGKLPGFLTEYCLLTVPLSRASSVKARPSSATMHSARRSTSMRPSIHSMPNQPSMAREVVSVNLSPLPTSMAFIGADIL